MFLVGVCCILYAHNDGKPKDGEKKYLPDRFPFDMRVKEDKTAYERTSQHKIVFVVGLILIIVSFQ